jgi:hypothetical protein
MKSNNATFDQQLIAPDAVFVKDSIEILASQLTKKDVIDYLREHHDLIKANPSYSPKTPDEFVLAFGTDETPMFLTLQTKRFAEPYNKGTYYGLKQSRLSPLQHGLEQQVINLITPDVVNIIQNTPSLLQSNIICQKFGVQLGDSSDLDPINYRISYDQRAQEALKQTAVALQQEISAIKNNQGLFQQEKKEALKEMQINRIKSILPKMQKAFPQEVISYETLEAKMQSMGFTCNFPGLPNIKDVIKDLNRQLRSLAKSCAIREEGEKQQMKLILRNSFNLNDKDYQEMRDQYITSRNSTENTYNSYNLQKFFNDTTFISISTQQAEVVLQDLLTNPDQYPLKAFDIMLKILPLKHEKREKVVNRQLEMQQAVMQEARNQLDALQNSIRSALRNPVDQQIGQDIEDESLIPKSRADLAKEQKEQNKQEFISALDGLLNNLQPDPIRNAKIIKAVKELKSDIENDVPGTSIPKKIIKVFLAIGTSVALLGAVASTFLYFMPLPLVMTIVTPLISNLAILGLTPLVSLMIATATIAVLGIALYTIVDKCMDKSDIKKLKYMQEACGNIIKKVDVNLKKVEANLTKVEGNLQKVEGNLAKDHSQGAGNQPGIIQKAGSNNLLYLERQEPSQTTLANLDLPESFDKKAIQQLKKQPSTKKTKVTGEEEIVQQKANLGKHTGNLQAEEVNTMNKTLIRL